MLQAIFCFCSKHHIQKPLRGERGLSGFLGHSPPLREVKAGIQEGIEAETVDKELVHLLCVSCSFDFLILLQLTCLGMVVSAMGSAFPYQSSIKMISYRHNQRPR